MLTDSETYRKLATADEQYAKIKVELGGFGLLQSESGAKVTWGEDEVVSCSVSCTVGDGGSFNIGSTEACECTLEVLTDPVKACLEYIELYDYRVSYGYEDQATGETEWLVMGVFATDRSLVTREGMSTTITLYDALYWLDGAKYSCDSTSRGTALSVRTMLDEVCAAGGLEVSEESYALVPDGMALSMYRPRTGSVRSAIGDVAAALFCSATAYDGKLHLVRIPTPPAAAGDGVESLTPDDFTDVPSYDFTESTMGFLVSSVTQTSEYTASSESDLAAPSFELIPVTTANCKKGKLKGFTATKKQKSGKNGSYYVLRVFKKSGTKKMCGIAGVDDPKSCDWASATAKSGTMKGKTLSAVYNAGRMLGVYVCAGVSVVGRGAFNLERYGKRAYLAGKSTKWFPAYTDGKNSYACSFADTMAKRGGPGFANKSNQMTDWSTISEWREDSVEGWMSYPGPDGSPEFDWDASGEGDQEADGNSIELDAELWGDDGSVNTLMGDEPLELIAADFAAICANANLPFTYVGSSTQMFGRNFYGVGDSMLVEDAYGDTYPVTVMSATYEYGGGITCELGCEGLDADTGASSYAGSQAASSTTKKAAQTTDRVIDKVNDVEDTVGELRIDQDSIVERLADAEGNIVEIVKNNDQLGTRVTNAEGNASTALQTANGLKDTVTDAAGNATTALQTAQGLKTTVDSVSGELSNVVQTQNVFQTELTTAKGWTAMMRNTSNGTLVCYEGSSTGALVSVGGHFDIVDLSWSDGAPTVGDTALARFDDTNGVVFADGTTFGPSGVKGLMYVSATRKFKATIKKGANGFKKSLTRAQLATSKELSYLDEYGFVPVAMVRLDSNKYGVVKLAGFDVNPNAVATDASSSYGKDGRTALNVRFTRNGSGSSKTVNSKSDSYSFYFYVQVLWARCSLDMVQEGDNDDILDVTDLDTGDAEADSSEDAGTASSDYVSGAWNSSTGKLTLTIG